MPNLRTGDKQNKLMDLMLRGCFLFISNLIDPLISIIVTPEPNNFLKDIYPPDESPDNLSIPWDTS